MRVLEERFADILPTGKLRFAPSPIIDGFFGGMPPLNALSALAVRRG